MFTVYVLRTNKNSLYIGQTSKLEARLKKHKEGKGAKYFRLIDSFELVYKEEFDSRSEALKREYELKQLSKKEKEKLITDSL